MPLTKTELLGSNYPWLRFDWGAFCVNCGVENIVPDERVCDPCCKPCADEILGEGVRGERTCC